MAITFTESALWNHDFYEEEILYAMDNHIRWIKGFEKSRVTGDPDPDLVIGPDPETDGLLEVMLTRYPSGDSLVFHCMELRPKFRHFVP